MIENSNDTSGVFDVTGVKIIISTAIVLEIAIRVTENNIIITLFFLIYNQIELFSIFEF